MAKIVFKGQVTSAQPAVPPALQEEVSSRCQRRYGSRHPSEQTYPLAALLLLGLPELVLEGAVQLAEEPHFLAVLQEPCWGRSLI